MATTLKDKIRDELVQYQKDTESGAAPDVEVLAEAIMDILRDYIRIELFSD